METKNRFADFVKMKNPLQVKGFEVPVYISDSGLFIGLLSEEDWETSSSLKELEKKLSNTIDRKKLTPVLFCKFTPRLGIQKGVCRGVHSSRGDFLVTWEDGRADVLSRCSAFHEVPAPAEEQKIKELVVQIEKLFDEIKALEPKKFDGAEMARRLSGVVADPVCPKET